MKEVFVSNEFSEFLSEHLKNVIEKMAELQTFFNKFAKVLEDLGGGKGVSLGWILFCLAKRQIFGENLEIIQGSCLLAVLVYYLLA